MKEWNNNTWTTTDITLMQANSLFFLEYLLEKKPLYKSIGFISIFDYILILFCDVSFPLWVEYLIFRQLPWTGTKSPLYFWLTINVHFRWIWQPCPQAAVYNAHAQFHSSWFLETVDVAVGFFFFLPKYLWVQY